jgi:hypothetical protein
MDEQINGMVETIQELEKENAELKLRLVAVSRRFFVCEDINYLNEMKVISTEFNSWEDADSFRKTMKEGSLYKHKSLLIINVC